MKNKYILTIEVESDKALKTVQKNLIQDCALFSLIEPKRKTDFNMPYTIITKIKLTKKN